MTTTFASLVFDNVGCCGCSHPWAEVRHANGKVSTVYEDCDGKYSVVTHAAGMLMRGQEVCGSPADVEKRLVEDAA